MKKVLALLLTAGMMVMGLAGCGSTGGAADAASSGGTESSAAEAGAEAGEQAAEAVAASSEGHTAAFVTFGLGADFFQSLADTFVSTMEDAGWEAQYADGQYDPTAQIEAAENFIAMGVDVLVIWSVAPEAMDGVIQQATDAGIKVIAFVAPTSQYDLLMLADDADLADNCAKLAAQWIDETYADAEDHSVPVAVFTCRTAETGVVQGDELLKIEDFSQKAKFVTEVECENEDMSVGQSKAENLYTSNPEIKVFLTAHNGLGMGINAFYTAVNSPATDYSDMGIFVINGDNATGDLIKGSVEGKNPMRGMVMTGGVEDTANEILWGCQGLMDGSIESGTVKNADTVFVFADTVDEYLSTGTVTSVSAADFE